MSDSAQFKSLNIAVLTVSDSRTEADDKSGNWLKQAVEETGHQCVAKAIVKDCLLYTSPSPRDATLSRMPSSA